MIKYTVKFLFLLLGFIFLIGCSNEKEDQFSNSQGYVSYEHKYTKEVDGATKSFVEVLTVPILSVRMQQSVYEQNTKCRQTFIEIDLGKKTNSDQSIHNLLRIELLDDQINSTLVSNNFKFMSVETFLTNIAVPGCIEIGGTIDINSPNVTEGSPVYNVSGTLDNNFRVMFIKNDTYQIIYNGKSTDGAKFKIVYTGKIVTI